MRVEYSKEAAKFISSLDKPTKERIRAAINGLTHTPPIGDIKHLQGYSIPTYRLRVGKYRVIYRYDANRNEQRILYISDIGSRSGIYK